MWQWLGWRRQLQFPLEALVFCGDSMQLSFLGPETPVPANRQWRDANRKWQDANRKWQDANRKWQHCKNWAVWPERLGHIAYRGEGDQMQAQGPRRLPGGHHHPIPLPTSHFTTSCRRGSSYHGMRGAIHQGMKTGIAIKWGECLRLDYLFCSFENLPGCAYLQGKQADSDSSWRNLITITFMLLSICQAWF